MNRAAALARLAAEPFDVVVIGGGASGLGTAVDAAARGYRTALIEAADFGGATSSRSTKLIHGGVRYLRGGDLRLVREALRERTLLLRNAPHLVRDLAFVIPAYRLRDLPYFGAGLAAYDLLAGKSPLPRSAIVRAARARAAIPALATRGLRGAVIYHDAQFDDARLAIALARTATDRGAAVANYVRAIGFRYSPQARITGVEAMDCETGTAFTIRGRVAINAGGIFADQVRALDEPSAPRLLAHSRGSHIVVAAAALGPASAALLVPRTRDGRVAFAVPWHGHVVIGTTDIPVVRVERAPYASEAEIAYLLATVNPYLSVPLVASDILATFAGLRPLVNRRATTTAALSREHLIEVLPSGLVTLAGGKWTTYRSMAAEVVDVAARRAGLAPAAAQTAWMPLHGALGPPPSDEALRAYGSDADALAALIRAEPALAERLDPRLPYTRAMVVYAARSEMARGVDDVLARRTRAASLDAAAARAAAPQVASDLARELGHDERWAAAQAAAFR